MMNILYLMNHAGKGGSEKYVKNMAEYCSLQGDNVFFIYNEAGQLAEQMEGLSKDISQFEMKSPMDFKAAKKLSLYCALHGIDVIHTQFARENYIAVLSKTFYGNKAKIIHTCHINTPNNRVWRIMNKMLMDKNDKIIAVCNSVKKLLVQNNYPPDKIQLVPNGVSYRENFERRAKGDETIKFVSLMRFSEEKGVRFLLESAKWLRSDGVIFSLVMAGDGPLYDDACEFVSVNGLSDIVSLPGYRSNVQELLAESDCFINASSSEALSFAILEAMESELCIIATDVGGNPYIVNERTRCGMLVPYGDTLEMAEAMKYIIQNKNEREQMARNAREVVKNTFNVDKLMKTTYNVYI